MTVKKWTSWSFFINCAFSVFNRIQACSTIVFSWLCDKDVAAICWPLVALVFSLNQFTTMIWILLFRWSWALFFSGITSINPSFNKSFYLSLKFFKLFRFLSVKFTTNNALDFCNLRSIRSIFTNILKFFKSPVFCDRKLNHISRVKKRSMWPCDKKT